MPKEINLDKFGSNLIHTVFLVLKVVIIKHPLLLVIVCCCPLSFPQGELRNYPGEPAWTQKGCDLRKLLTGGQ